MITVELEHFSLDKICDSGQCFRMKKLGDGHFSMVAGDQYLEMRQKGGVVDFYCSQEEFICYWVLYFDLDTDYETYMNAANPRDKYLGAAIKAGDGIRILRQDLWEMIVTFPSRIISNASANVSKLSVGNMESEKFHQQVWNIMRFQLWRR